MLSFHMAKFFEQFFEQLGRYPSLHYISMRYEYFIYSMHSALCGNTILLSLFRYIQETMSKSKILG